MIETPRTTDTPSRHIAFIPLVVPRDEIRHVMGPGIQEVYAAITAQGRAPTGPWFTFHHRRPTDSFDFKICVPVDTPVAPTGRVLAGELPAQKVIRTVYHGPYEGLGQAWGEFIGWVAANGMTVSAELWEAYIVGPESSANPADWRTELNLPLVG